MCRARSRPASTRSRSAPRPRAKPPAGFTGITGVSSAAGDRVVMTAGRPAVVVGPRALRARRPRTIGLVHDLVLDEGEDVAWVATLDGLERVPAAGRLQAAGRSEPLRRVDQKLVDRLRRREAWQLRNDEAAALLLDADAPRRQRRGVPARRRPGRGLLARDCRGRDVAAAGQGARSNLWVWPELAYRFETHPSRGGHLFDLGVGVGFGTHLVAAFYRPRLVLGGHRSPAPRTGRRSTACATGSRSRPCGGSSASRSASSSSGATRAASTTSVWA